MSLARRRAAAQRRASDPGFVAWYGAYPKKVAAADALKAWEQTEADRPALGEMLTTLDWQVATDFSKRPYDKIPYPARYLRVGQYRDQRPQAGGTSKPTPPAAPVGVCKWHVPASSLNRKAPTHDPACSECRHVSALQRQRNGETEPTPIGDLLEGGK